MLIWMESVLFPYSNVRKKEKSVIIDGRNEKEVRRVYANEN